MTHEMLTLARGECGVHQSGGTGRNHTGAIDSTKNSGFLNMGAVVTTNNMHA
ncbi:hypothetical protein ABIA39_009111 [Nocardia sp. GAS34]|uniref:hypothetical protein n=1 Tax=unclassified Nocardia TaxID=2637762 RepID=UPI003D228257